MSLWRALNAGQKRSLKRLPKTPAGDDLGRRKGGVKKLLNARGLESSWVIDRRVIRNDVVALHQLNFWNAHLKRSAFT